MATETPSLILGRGQVFFNRYAAGTRNGLGSLYLGNTPSLSLTRSQTNLDHYDSERGIRVKDRSVVLDDDMTGSLTTDNMKPDNMALFFGGAVQQVTQAAITTAVTEDITVIQGAFYRIGVTTARPDGLDNVTVTQVVIPPASTPIVATGNWEWDVESQLLRILPGAPDLPSGTTIRISYTALASSYWRITDSRETVEGELTYRATNPVGPQVDYFFPHVKLTPQGEFQLKGDTFQAMTFNLEVLKKDGSTPRYVMRHDGRIGGNS